MSRCPDTDAILTIGEALGWEGDVQEGLRHLQTCDDCRSRIEVLRLAHTGLAETAPVDVVALRNVTAAVGVVATRERQRGRNADALARWAEPALAGATALVVVTSSRVPVDSVGSAILAFALGVALLLGGRAVATRVPHLSS